MDSGRAFDEDFILVGAAQLAPLHAPGVTDDLTKRFNAVDLVRIGAEALGGKGGGGRPDLAQAGGPDAAQANAALAAVERAVAARAEAAA